MEKFQVVEVHHSTIPENLDKYITSALFFIERPKSWAQYQLIHRKPDNFKLQAHLPEILQNASRHKI